MAQLLPVNYDVDTVVRTAADRGFTVEAPDEASKPSVADLSSWEQELYQLDTKVAASLGFPVVSLKGDVHEQVLLMSTARYKDVTKGKTTYRYGVALRVLVRVETTNLQGSLTLPSIAASVEIANARASAMLSVRGYSGELTMPSWQSFNVESYSDYQKTVDKIQSTILKNSADVTPVLLASTALAPTVPGSQEVVGLIHALDAIAHGDSQDEALSNLGFDDETARLAVEHQYTALGVNAGASPSDQQRQQARESLKQLHLHWMSRVFGY